MENKKYLDKVVEFLVRDTDIYYEDRTIGIDSYWGNDSIDEWKYEDYNYILDYCVVTYGLTEDEVKYVWKKYRTIIKDKIKDGK